MISTSNTPIMTLQQVRMTGMHALFQHLGAVGMVRFLQQFQTGWGDYSQDRHAWLDQEDDVRSLAQKIIEQRTAIS